jgi:hypothetical protein
MLRSSCRSTTRLFIVKHCQTSPNMFGVLESFPVDILRCGVTVLQNRLYILAATHRGYGVCMCKEHMHV